MELKSIMLCYANSLQSCPTLCDPVDGSLPASPVPGILEARTLEWVAISFSSAWKWKVKVKSLSRVQLLESIITEIKNSLQGFSSTFRLTKGSVNMKISQFSSVQFSHSVVSDSVRPCRRQPTRLLHPWDFPGKNTGVGCHFLLQCMKVKSLSRVRLFVIPWTAAYQAPLPMGFSRQEYWSGVPLPSPSNILGSSNAQPCSRLPWFFLTRTNWLGLPWAHPPWQALH